MADQTEDVHAPLKGDDGGKRLPKRAKVIICACLFVVILALAIGLPLGLKKKDQEGDKQLWGCVSVVFSGLLAGGQSFEQIIPQTPITYLELRQLTLGSPLESVDGQGIPNPQVIGALQRQFPALRITYTFSYPLYLNPDPLPLSVLFNAALATARELAAAQNKPIFLRVFDLTTTAASFDPTITDNIVNAIYLMTAQVVATDPNGVFVLENLKMPFSLFGPVVKAAHERVVAAFGPGRLLFCYDPANQVIFTGEGTEGIQNTTVALLSDTKAGTFPPLALLHAKQSTGLGNNLDEFLIGATGTQVPWPFIASELVNGFHYKGPILFEIDGNGDSLGALVRGQSALRELGFNV